MWFMLFVALGCSPKVIEGTHAFAGQTADWSAYVPETSDGELSAAVLLPADGSEHSWLPTRRALRRWATEHDYLVFSMNAPGPGGTGCWWSPHKHQRAAFLADAIEQVVIGELGVPGERVVLGGWSGGAFLAFGSPFYVDMPATGGFVGVCGGDLPREDSDVDWCEVDESQDDPELELSSETWAAVAEGKRVYLARNDDDDWVVAVDATARAWEAAGAEVRTVSEGDGGHCALPVVQRLVDGLDWIDER